MNLNTPRRNRADQWCDAEEAIANAMQEVEKMGADVRLTNAVIKLTEAKNHVADFVDEVPAPVETFMDRLKKEGADLNEKIGKLSVFIDSDKFESVDKIQKSLLKAQLAAMVTYTKILQERINWLEAVETSR